MSFVVNDMSVSRSGYAVETAPVGEPSSSGCAADRGATKARRCDGDHQATGAAKQVALTGPAAAVPKSVHRWYARVIRDDGPGILRMLWRMLGNEQDVLDAYQESWCLLAQLGTPRDVRSVRAYVYRTASNVAIEMIRRRKRRQGHWDAVVERYQRESAAGEADADQRNPGRSDDPSDCTETLRELVGELPPHLRNVVTLRDLAGMKYQEVGSVLGIDPATARVYRRQAILRMAELARRGGAGEVSSS